MKHNTSLVRFGCCLVALSVLLVGCADSPHSGTPASSGTGSSTDPQQQRLNDIAATAAGLDRSVAEHGGSWEAWKKQTAPFRADLARITRGKWPWPAKKNFRFLGRSARLLMLESWTPRPPEQRPWETIVHLNQQLRSRGIDLIFVPIPDKIATYPDYISDKTPEDRAVSWQARKLLRKLCDEGVEVVDLYPVFRRARRELGEDKPLFYDRDSHWRNRAAVLTAEQIAERLKRYPFVRKALAEGSPYTTSPFHRSEGTSKEDDVLLVRRREDGKEYSDVADSPVVLAGDSFTMYNMHLNAHLSAHVGRLIGLPLTYICREGLAQQVPVELASRQKQTGFLKGRRVLLWVVRGRSLGEKNWKPAELPQAPAKPDGRDVHALKATGTVQAVSSGPDPQSEYADYIMKVHVKDLQDADGWGAVRNGQAVVRVLAMQDHRILPAAAIKPGREVTLKLTTWAAKEPAWGRTHTGSLADTKAETDLPQFWGELTER